MKDQRINIKKWHKYAKENRIPKFLANPPIDRVLLKINPQFIPIFFWKPFSIALTFPRFSSS